MKRVLRYFLQGLLITTPLFITVYVIAIIVTWMDGLIETAIPGLGIAIIIGGLILLGFLGSTLIARPIIHLIERLMNRLPLVKLLYTSIKDLAEAFVGEKKKFDKPVLVTVGKGAGLQKIGFITQASLENMGLSDKVAVYLPHSYNFSGNLFIVPKENITPLDLPGSDVMKFVVSGGISGIETKAEKN